MTTGQDINEGKLGKGCKEHYLHYFSNVSVRLALFQRISYHLWGNSILEPGPTGKQKSQVSLPSDLARTLSNLYGNYSYYMFPQTVTC